MSSTTAHHTRTLVLNSGYEPLAVVSFRRALALVMVGKAAIIRAHDDQVCSSRGNWDRPAVIVLTRYVRAPYSRAIPVTRRGVLRRDEHRCAYCGSHANTIDHVLPRSRGGKDTWENLVACCLKCNNKKSDKTLDEIGWQLPFAPRMPQGLAWSIRGAERLEPEWDAFLVYDAAA